MMLDIIEISEGIDGVEDGGEEGFDFGVFGFAFVAFLFFGFLEEHDDGADIKLVDYFR